MLRGPRQSRLRRGLCISNPDYLHYYAGHAEIQTYLLRMAEKYKTREV